MKEELTYAEMKITKKAELVFIPAPAIGHLVSAVEFAKRLVQRDPRLSITVLLIKTATLAHKIDAYKNSLAAVEPRVKFVDLPQVEPPPPELFAVSVEHYVTLLIEAYKPSIKREVENLESRLGSANRLTGLVLDFFCVSMIDVGDELGIPSYIYLTSGASFLSLMLYLPSRHERVATEFTKSDPEFVMPGFTNPVSTRDLPSGVFNKDGGYSAFIKMAKRFRDAEGIIVNTIMELESSAIRSLSDEKTPPIYTVGPVLDLTGEGQMTLGSSIQLAHRSKIVEWLDEQPDSSVVFLCFGSAGIFPAPQLIEIAHGLDRSGHRFLWSIRAPAGCSDINEILPDGFVERMKKRGLICGWVPQVEILAHRSIGGFVSHCGWNSILESLWQGVPIVTWPLYAEQQLNALSLVKELGIAVELRLGCRKEGDEVVMAEEIERAVRSVMDSDNQVRLKVMQMREKSRKAKMEGGSSYDMIQRLIEDMLN